MPSSGQGPRVLYWFRTDLRLHDSPALAKALSLSPSALFPIFNWDPNYIYGHRVGINRFRFLLESLQDLSNEIKKLNGDSQLLLTRGAPQTRIRELCEKWQITHVAFEEDHNAYARHRDAAVVESLKAANIEVISQEGRHLYPIKEVLKNTKGQPPTSMSQLQKAVASLGDVAQPAETPTSLPSPCPPGSDKADIKKLFDLISDLSSYKEEVGTPDVDLNAAELGGQRKSGPDGEVTSYDTVAAGEKSKYKEEKSPFAVPTLASLGMEEPEVKLAEPIRGGTTEALRRLKKLTEDPAYLSTFAKPQTSPSTDPDAPSTTLLSPYIKFGCLGIRHYWHTVKETKKKHKGAKTDVPEGMEGQLLFRDMYAVCEAAVGDAFHGVRGNKISHYMDWYLPTVYDKDGKQVEPRPRGDDVSEERLRTFKEGQTGFPWIDALMRQLRMTGWIHHLGRHSVAAYLTRAQCWISWERGAEIFHEFLIDTDDASNDGNWMWLSASAFFSQYFRVYGLTTFPAKYDKHGYIVRKYCPELKDFPDKYIYAPHTAPKEVQEKAKCIIGKDYPFPVLDEKEEKKHCLDRCKAAYDSKLFGNSKEVLEGKAEGMLRKKHGVPDPKNFNYKENAANKIRARTGRRRRLLFPTPSTP
ncbi:Cryptochrome/photolyase FAD-binding domain-containing protein [Microstroma glucosiphilum]|uniref:Cryptochrome/photolyase FAD-binding domain-containing protein n=1 Tax=Pseudomicrostroma glucosiphilum TaxID=1684307 RepID=A0A316U3C4_9BASI|nr:Cryptochrome/photolyase FAD-binding domain-containing protein [Pseudomicrostroma glucosiphilum]PWN19799.1 Cryptochrome/photolyase FAD-binding domain-containing protein [Pseudomicrostroma glucosiphilum]